MSYHLGDNCMNYITVKDIQTQYHYYESYWIIDGIPIVNYLEQYKTDSLNWFGSLLELLPTWSGKLIWQWENDFVWEMIDNEEECNIPILVCEEDCDFSCIVIIAHIRKTENIVYWDKIGLLDKSNIDSQEYRESGILCLENYTDEDWEKYGDNIATECYDSVEYWKWVSENNYEENIRRLRNYLKPYMQKEQNIEWIWSPHWEFELKNYETMVEQYRKLKSDEQNKL